MSTAAVNNSTYLPGPGGLLLPDWLRRPFLAPPRRKTCQCKKRRRNSWSGFPWQLGANILPFFNGCQECDCEQESSQSNPSNSSSSTGCVCGYACLFDGTPSVCQVQVTLAGIGTGTCAASCSSLNSSFLLTGSGCSWIHTLSSPINCGTKTFDRVMAEYFNGGGGNVSLRVRVVSTDFPTLGSVQILYGTALSTDKFDCENLVNYSVPFAANPAAGNCQSDGTAALVTSIVT